MAPFSQVMEPPQFPGRFILTARQKGLDRFLGASLAFAEPAARLAYRNVLANGLNELEALLQGDGVL